MGAGLFLCLENNSQRRYPITPEALRIGRSHDNHVVLADNAVSRHHAAIWAKEGRHYVRDEGSSNGTWLNGHKVLGEQELHPGDHLQIGSAVFVVRSSASEMAATRVRVPGKRRQRWFSWLTLAGGGALLVALLVVLTILLVGSNSGQAGPPTPASILLNAVPTPVSSAQARQRALLATVQLLVPIEGTGDDVGGSGTILTPQGYVLTNFHVVGNRDTGRLHNRPGVIYVAVNPPGLNASPAITYLAELVKGDLALDLALLRIVALSDGRPLPAELNLPTVPLGDSDTVQIGDTLYAIGFPGLGGNTVTLTRGTVSGFLEEGEQARAWIKTDAEINRGNSGGLAINEAGEMIGVPTAGRIDTEVAGKIGLVRPINLARPLIELAQGR